MHTPVQVTDLELQGLFDEQTYRLGRSDARGDAVGEVRVDGERVRGAVQGNRPRPFELWVRREGDRIVSQCNCPDWAGARRHCRHVAALLYMLIDEEAVARPTESRNGVSTPLTVWLPADGPTRVPIRLSYILSFDGDWMSVARRRAEQRTDVAEGDLDRLSTEDQRIAEAISHLPRAETGSGYRVQRRQSGDLLAMLRGRAVYLDDRQQLPLGFSDVPLGLRVAGHRPAEPDGPFRFTATVAPRGAERAFRPAAVKLLGGLERFGIADDVAYPLDDRLTLSALERFQAHGQVDVRADELARAFGEWLPRLADELGATVPPPRS